MFNCIYGLKFRYLFNSSCRLHTVLYNAAIESGAKVLVNARVESVDDTTTSVILYNGTAFQADPIIRADGICSKIRTAVILEQVIQPRRSNNCAYRATVPAEIMRADPQIAHLMDDINSNFWIGYRCHIVGYPMKMVNYTTLSCPIQVKLLYINGMSQEI